MNKKKGKNEETGKKGDQILGPSLRSALKPNARAYNILSSIKK